jgi:prevent-host-death family protein
MRQVPLSELKDDLSRFLREAASRQIVITRHGKPAGLLIGFDSEDDWFDYRLENDPQFLRRIEQARDSLRAGHGVRLEDLDSAVRSRSPSAIRKSVTPDYLICLEDGKKLKMLKRHLSSTYNMTPDQYRKKWGLSADYPMVAPNYARQRSRLAKRINLEQSTDRRLPRRRFKK